MKVVIASDSFKESLSSAQVAEAAARGILSARPAAEVVCLNIADGGEGVLDALSPALGAQTVEVRVRGPLGREVTAAYGISGGTAIIESAAACGLMLLSPEERNPVEASSFGLGQMIADALDRGCRDFVVGIGGSAVNDAGIGMLEALGWKFFDRDGTVLPGKGASLASIELVDDSGADARLRDTEFTIACDVSNPFFGPEGAAFVFAAQKGADLHQITFLDEGLRNFARVISAKTGMDVQQIRGSGAAGGLGGAFAAFLGAGLRSGADIVLDAVGFDDAIRGACMVITGEGCIDSQTLSGKAPGAVLMRALEAGVPVVAICGRLKLCAGLEDAGFRKIIQVTPDGMPLEEALNPSTAADNVVRACRDLIDF